MAINTTVCTNDCLGIEPRIKTKYDLFRFVCMRAKQLESDPTTPLEYRMRITGGSKVYAGNQQLSKEQAAMVLGRASILKINTKRSNLETAMREIRYDVKSPAIEEALSAVEHYADYQNNYLQLNNAEQAEASSSMNHEGVDSSHDHKLIGTEIEDEAPETGDIEDIDVIDVLEGEIDNLEGLDPNSDIIESD